jgi:hypothetical protein
VVRYVVVASLVMAEIDLPDFRTMLANSASDSLRRRRRTLTCTLSLKSSELRKYVGLRLFIMFTRTEGVSLALKGGRNWRLLGWQGLVATMTIALLAKISSQPRKPAASPSVPRYSNFLV